jgi:hypothetical protein
LKTVRDGMEGSGEDHIYTLKLTTLFLTAENQKMHRLVGIVVTLRALFDGCLVRLSDGTQTILTVLWAYLTPYWQVVTGPRRQLSLMFSQFVIHHPHYNSALDSVSKRTTTPVSFPSVVTDVHVICKGVFIAVFLRTNVSLGHWVLLWIYNNVLELKSETLIEIKNR